MKLLMCKKCQDVFKLQSEARTCKCGAVGGQYQDDVQAVYWGKDAVPLAFSNSSLANVLKQGVLKEAAPAYTRWFDAYVAASDSPTYRKIKNPRPPMKAQRSKKVVSEMERKGLGHTASSSMRQERASIMFRD